MGPLVETHRLALTGDRYSGMHRRHRPEGTIGVSRSAHVASNGRVIRHDHFPRITTPFGPSLPSSELSTPLAGRIRGVAVRGCGTAAAGRVRRRVAAGW